MKKCLVILAFTFFACGGSLSDEQRKKMREQMELHEIKRVTEAEITALAFTKGRAIITALEKIQNDSSVRDSLSEAHDASIRWLTPSAENAIELEKQLIEAYVAGGSNASLQDNVQKARNSSGDSDSLLYTKPVVIKQPDGTDKLQGVWNVWLSRKQLILSMDKK